MSAQPTSSVIRNSINLAWERHDRLLKDSYTALARGQREAIREMEQDYKAARKRECREARRAT